MTAPIGLGTDLVEVARIAALLAAKADSFKAKCFTKGEQADAERSGPDRAAERYAARFAAKEAVLKALGTGWAEGIGWTDVEVVLDSVGAPTVALHGRAAEVAAERGIERWLCSLSHTASHATATAIAMGRG